MFNAGKSQSRFLQNFYATVCTVSIVPFQVELKGVSSSYKCCKRLGCDSFSLFLILSFFGPRLNFQDKNHKKYKNHCPIPEIL